LPFKTPKWDSGELVLHDPSSKVGWGDLKKVLKNQGYKQGCTLFDVPYDWTLPNERSRDLYLIPWKNKAEKKTGSRQVDIIAHSLGGLVTRAYVQSDQYAHDVRRFAMAATPNKGSGRAYYIWEGGDPIKADEVDDSNDSWFAKYFYTNTLDYLYNDRKGKHICEFGTLDRYTPKDEDSCDTKKIYDFLHVGGRAIGQLMPIYDDALLHHASHENIPILKEENTFLRALNNLPCRGEKGCIDPRGRLYSFFPAENIFTKDDSGVHAEIFVGTEHHTIRSNYVAPQPPEYTGKLYRDGAPQPRGIYITKDDGDRVVLKTSAIFNDYLPKDKSLPCFLMESKHSEVIKRLGRSIASFIKDGTGTDCPLSFPAFHESEEPHSQLVISVDGRIMSSIASVTSLEGKPIKIAAEDEKESLNLDSSSLTIDNPQDGDYTIALRSPYSENYTISVTYYNADNDTFIERRGEGFYSDSLKHFTLTVKKGSAHNEDTITFDRVFDSPINLKMQNVGHKIQLTWEDPTGDVKQDVSKYAIFWRRDSEPYFQFLGQTSSKNYQTNHDWTDMDKNIYMVTAVLKDAHTTFFSEPEFFIPETSLSQEASLRYKK
jgi:hypothetical protein